MTFCVLTRALRRLAQLPACTRYTTCLLIRPFGPRSTCEMERVCICCAALRPTQPLTPPRPAPSRRRRAPPPSPPRGSPSSGRRRTAGAPRRRRRSRCPAGRRRRTRRAAASRILCTSSRSSRTPRRCSGRLKRPEGSCVSALLNADEKRRRGARTVEGALRAGAADHGHGVQLLHDEVAPLLVLRPHHLNVVLRARQRRDAGDLGEGGGAADGVRHVQVAAVGERLRHRRLVSRQSLALEAYRVE